MIIYRPDQKTGHGKNILAEADILKKLYNELENAFYNCFVSSANGVYLDRATYNLQRITAKPSQVGLEFVLISGAVLLTGDTFSVAGGTQLFTLLSSYTASSDITVTLFAQSETTGTIANDVLPNTITEPLRDIDGLESVTNPLSPTGGRNIETDEEFRVRALGIYEQANVVSSSIVSLRNRIQSLNGVSQVKILSNVKTVTDETTGLIGHSVEAIVKGGVDNDIFEALEDIVAGGIAVFSGASAQAVVTKEVDGLEFKFSRPVDVSVKVKVVITSKLTQLPTNTIKDYIVQFIGGVDSLRHEPHRNKHR